MTKNQNDYRDIQEKKRHNKRMEETDRMRASKDKGALIQKSVMDALNHVNDVAGTVAQIVSKKGSNDPAWYKLNPKLAEIAGKLSFALPEGVKYEIGSNTNLGELTDIVAAGIEYVPSIGGATQAKVASAIEIAFQSLYADDRAVNAGYANYDPVDVAMYVMAVVEAYSLAAYIYRGLRIAKSFSDVNRALPLTLLAAGGYDAGTSTNCPWRSEEANTLAALNAALARLNQFPIPNTMSLLSRRVWMNSGVFADHASGKAQFYIFRPCFFGKYDETSFTAGGGLKMDGLGCFGDHSGYTYYTPKLALEQLEDMINALARSQDVGVIAGDLIKAFEYKDAKNPLAGKRYQFPELPSVTPTIDIIYSEEVLEQIHNMDCLGAYFEQDLGSALFDIRQNADGRLIQGVDAGSSGTDYLSGTKYISAIPLHLWSSGDYAGNTVRAGDVTNLEYQRKVMLNSREDSPSVDTILVDTRLKVGIVAASGKISNETFGSIIESSGTELAGSVLFYGVKSISSTSVTFDVLDLPSYKLNFVLPTTATRNEVDSIVKFIEVYTKFDWMPCITMAGKVNALALTTERVIGDVNVFAFSGTDWLASVHNCCLFSEFGMKFTYGAPVN